MNSKQRFRSRFIFAFIVIGAGFLASTLYQIQIMSGRSYVSKADDQYTKPSASLFDRGSIYFEDKEGTRLAGATQNFGFLIHMNPSMISDPEQVYEALSQYIKLDKETFIKKASNQQSRYEELSNKVDLPTSQSIKDLKVNGVIVTKISKRIYPGQTLAAHVLGIIGEDANSALQTGRYGLERSYESILNRKTEAGMNVFASLFIDLRKTVFSGKNEKEGDIITTIEPTTEKYLEKILGQISTQWHSDEIGGIIMDPQTGEIRAMASLPNFNPNDISSVKNVLVLSNPLVENAYELGSIMKPLTMAVALDSGAVTPTSKYDDTGTMTLSGKKISNYDGKARGVVSMQEILSQSLNVGAATIALKVNKNEFVKYFTSFGFGERTGIDQPNETAGIVNNLKTARDVEIATAAYGQGIAVSPVNMARALSVLANGGNLVTPHLVKKIEYSDGASKSVTPIVKSGILKKQTTDDVTSMLVKVVDEKIAKAHPNIYFKNYSIAAKTGTAQIADSKNGGYYSDRYLHSFFGYFPAYNPKFIVFLYHINPKGADFASETLTEPFSDLTKFLIDYYDVTPDR